jgi:predicted phosphodiesterase
MHGNSDAFEAVLRRVRRKHFDAVLMLGDVVGYGAGPNQVVDAVRALPGKVYSVRGNHDKVVSGVESGDNFNSSALVAARWTTARLTATNLRFVRELPRGPLVIEDGLSICHGSPLDEDTYVFSAFEAFEIFSAHAARVTFFGHTHVPSLFAQRGENVRVALLRGGEGSLALDATARYLLNPGSIGQPRDRDPRASFMIYDSDAMLVRWFRVEYPIQRAQRRIVKAGLPRPLADRLALGM